MKVIIPFLLFFLLFPIFISSVSTMRRLLAGPEDDSLYALQTFAEFRRRALVELVVSYVILLIGSGLMIWFAIMQQ